MKEPIESFLGLISDESARKNLLKLYSERKTIIEGMPVPYKKGFQKNLHELISGMLYLGHKFHQAFNSDYEIAETPAVKDPMFTLDDVLISCFAACLDDLLYYKKTDGQNDFYEKVQEWDIPRVSSIVLILSSYKVQLTNLQLNAISFRDGGWSAEAKDGMVPSPLAILVHSVYMMASQWRPLNKFVPALPEENPEPL